MSYSAGSKSFPLSSLLLGVAGGLIHGTVFGAVLAALAYVLLDVALGVSPTVSRAVALSIWPLAVLGMLAVHLVAARERLAGTLGEFGEFAQNPADGSLNTAIAVGVPGSGSGVGR